LDVSVFKEYFAKGGNLSRDRKYVNYRQDYEVRYSKGKGRHGYGNLKFANGGAMKMSRISGVLIIASISLTIIAVYTIGIWGAPAAMVATYLLTTLLVQKELRGAINDG
jgi:hypothetical protein